jgi:nitric oxide dioxygenase
VKREINPDSNINGMISNQLHDTTPVDSFVELSAPAGQFVLPQQPTAPLTFISGGVGITPMMSMVEHLLQQNSIVPITWIHGCRNEAAHAFKDKIKEFSKKNNNLKIYTFYEQCPEGNKADNIYEGYPEISRIKEWGDKATTYFICGPSRFIQKQFNDLRKQGIDARNILFEEFGPQLLHLN